MERTRVDWLDTARGVGIVLVVFGHAWRGLYSSSHLKIDGWMFQTVDAVIYSFHMPLFFFLSGTFFIQLLESKSFTQVLRSRIVRLLWPMTLWTWLFVGVKLLAGDAQNEVVALSDFPIFPLPPRYHLWFLWALFVIQIFVAFCWMAGLRLKVRPVSHIVLAVLSLVMCLAMPLIPKVFGWFNSAVIFLPFFLAGMAVETLVGFRPGHRVTILCGLSAVCLAMLAGLEQWVGASLVSLIIVLLLCVAIAGIDRHGLQAGRLMRCIRFAGQASLAIYVMHTIFSGAMREGLIALGVTEIWLHLLLGTVVGLVLPCLVYVWCRGTRFMPLLGLK